MSEVRNLFEKQYTDKKLAYRVSFPTLRKLFKKHLCTRYDVTIKLLNGIQGERILDYGCGDGRLLFQLHPQFNECHGLDIVSSRIRQARNYVDLNFPELKGKFHFVQNSPDKPIAYPDEYFDVVLCIAVLPWIYNPYSIGKEFYRVLKHGGYLVMECANFAYFKNRLKLLLGRLPTTTPIDISLWPEVGWDSGCLHYFTRKTLINFLKQCNFKVEQVKASGLLSNLIKILVDFFATGWVILAKKRSN